MQGKIFRLFSVLLISIFIVSCSKTEEPPVKYPQPLYGQYELITRVEVTENSSYPAEEVEDEIWTFNHNNTFNIKIKDVSYDGEYRQSNGTIDIGYVLPNPLGDGSVVIIGAYEDTSDNLITMVYDQQTLKYIENEEGKKEQVVTLQHFAATFRKLPLQ